MADAEAAMDADGAPFFLAFVGLNLSDAPDGEAVSKTLALGIPSVLLTATFDESVRARFLERGALDFVLKDHPSQLAPSDQLDPAHFAKPNGDRFGGRQC